MKLLSFICLVLLIHNTWSSKYDQNKIKDTLNRLIAKAAELDEALHSRNLSFRVILKSLFDSPSDLTRVLNAMQEIDEFYEKALIYNKEDTFFKWSWDYQLHGQGKLCEISEGIWKIKELIYPKLSSKWDLDMSQLNTNSVPRGRVKSCNGFDDLKNKYQYFILSTILVELKFMVIITSYYSHHNFTFDDATVNNLPKNNEDSLSRVKEYISFIQNIKNKIPVEFLHCESRLIISENDRIFRELNLIYDGNWLKLGDGLILDWDPKNRKN